VLRLSSRKYGRKLTDSTRTILTRALSSICMVSFKISSILSQNCKISMYQHPVSCPHSVCWRFPPYVHISPPMTKQFRFTRGYLDSIFRVEVTLRMVFIPACRGAVAYLEIQKGGPTRVITVMLSVVVPSDV
jgi:hypothetical protein